MSFCSTPLRAKAYHTDKPMGVLVWKVIGENFDSRKWLYILGNEYFSDIF